MDFNKKNLVFLNYYLFADQKEVTTSTPLVNVNVVDKAGSLSMVTEDELLLIGSVVKFLKERKGSIIVVPNALFFMEILEIRYDFLTGKKLDFDWKDFKFYNMRDDITDRDIMYCYGMTDYYDVGEIIEACIGHDFIKLKSIMRKKLIMMSRIFEYLIKIELKSDVKIRLMGISENVKKSNIMKEEMIEITPIIPKSKIDPVTGEPL